MAGLLLAFGLTAAVATAVGVAAWSLGATGGYTSDRVATLQQDANQRGLTAGIEQGRHSCKAAGQRKGISSGEHKGYQHGYQKGFARGQKVGYQRGHTAGDRRLYSRDQADG